MPARRLTLGGLGLLASLTFVSVVVATAATMAIWVYRGARPPEPQGPSAPVVPTRDPGNLLLGGTGAALPLLERLAEAFRQGRGPALCVAPSIGSGGGIRALRDGVIDAAVVSRPLSPDEAEGLQQIPFATGRVILAAGRGVPDRSISPERLLGLFRGSRPVWSDGSPAELILREPRDSGTEAFAASVEGLREEARRAAEEGRWPVALTDREMQDTLVSHPRAVGIFDAGIIRLEDLPLREIEVEGRGVAPSRSFVLVLRPDAPAAIRGFARFVCSPEARGFMERYGYRGGPCTQAPEAPDA